MSRHPQSVFGKRLRQLRKRKNVPQDKLGVLIGLDESTSSARISRYETGVHEPPFAVAEKIAKALDTPVAYFFCPEDELAALLLIVSALDRKERAKVLNFAETLPDVSAKQG